MCTVSSYAEKYYLTASVSTAAASECCLGFDYCSILPMPGYLLFSASATAASPADNSMFTFYIFTQRGDSHIREVPLKTQQIFNLKMCILKLT